MFLIFSKKRIILICFCIILSICIIIGVGFHSYSNNNNQNIIPKIILPANKKTIVIDPGHGLPDGGASTADGVLESDINLKIALKLQKLLEQSGAIVILTRNDENGISGLKNASIREKHRTDLKNRVRIGNESSADMFISIHLNKIPQSQYSGWQTFYKKDNEESKNLAQSLQNGLNQSIQKENKREPAKISGIYIVDNIKIPISIVECGFLSNPEEAKLLQTEEYQEKLAEGIYKRNIKLFT